jgi:hypothetical protein
VLRILGAFVAQRLPTIGSDPKKPSLEQSQAALALVWNDFSVTTASLDSPRMSSPSSGKQEKEMTMHLTHMRRSGTIFVP